MKNNETIACVTGGSGMVGRRIVLRLLDEGYKVRVLSRKRSFFESRAEHFCGGLQDEQTLKKFINGANIVFHCAAELYNETLMWEVNVKGTERLLSAVKGENIHFFCYLSTAIVVGRTREKWVNESTPCNPQKVYERSKWAAEQMVAQGIEGCSVVILRPSLVVNNSRPAALAIPMKRTFLDYVKVWLKGGECAHIVHADDVASAAIFFITRHFDRPQCFFVSSDHEQINTHAKLWSFYKACKNGQDAFMDYHVMHLPIILPYIVRKICGRTGNRGDVRYSSEKLISEGFKYSVGLQGAVKRLVLGDGKA